MDLIIKPGKELCPVEIKLTATPIGKHLESLNKFKIIAGKDSAETGLLVCRINKTTRPFLYKHGQNPFKGCVQISNAKGRFVWQV